MKTTGANDILGSLSPASLPDRAITYAVDVAKSVYRLILRRIERTAGQGELRVQSAALAEGSLRQSLAQGRGPRRLSGSAGTNRKPAKGRQPDSAHQRAEILSVSHRRIGRTDRAPLRRRQADRGARNRIRLQSVFASPATTRTGPSRDFDISPNGIAAGREIADHFALSDKISLDRIDLTDACGSQPCRDRGRGRPSPISASSKFRTTCGRWSRTSSPPNRSASSTSSRRPSCST